MSASLATCAYCCWRGGRLYDGSMSGRLKNSAIKEECGLGQVASRIAPKAIPGSPHPIPYQGSKRQLARLIVGLFPVDTQRLIEPFAGSAAVSLGAAHLKRAQRFCLNDVHEPLMDLWRGIVEKPAETAAKYRRIWEAQLGDERRYYDEVRARFNEYRRPEDFLYLLARCVKAAIRYNAQGQFNNSPDNRRKGAHPDTMERHIHGAADLLAGRTRFSAEDYRQALRAARPADVVYMDPPYQGVCDTHNHRYLRGVPFEEFVEALADLNTRGVPFLVSYDGRTGSKTFGSRLPDSLGLRHIEILAGRSTQATLLGRDCRTYESLYLSPALLERHKHSPPVANQGAYQPDLFADAI